MAKKKKAAAKPAKPLSQAKKESIAKPAPKKSKLITVKNKAVQLVTNACYLLPGDRFVIYLGPITKKTQDVTWNDDGTATFIDTSRDGFPIIKIDDPKKCALVAYADKLGNKKLLKALDSNADSPKVSQWTVSPIDLIEMRKATITPWTAAQE